MAPKAQPLRIGLIGAGIGGVAAAISLKKNGGDLCQVTVLEAASELGEIGAGIQMTPNVSRLLIRWGVDKVIGENLVEFEHLILRDKAGERIGFAEMDSRRWTGVPWWLVHRMHLHDGLVKVAKESGAVLVTGARITEIDYQNGPEVKVKSAAGGDWTFDLVIGSDGLNSIVRKTFLPEVQPKPPTNNAAFRAIVPMEKVRRDPLTRHLAQRPQMDLWMSAKPSFGEPHGYIITYPISNNEDFNMVLNHFTPSPVSAVQEASHEEVIETYKNHDPAIRRCIEMIEHPLKRWPLLLTLCPTWSSPQKNLVLMGDAAHSMVNHMAQGAATSMEDGAFLAIALSLVAKGKIRLSEAVELYEKERMPLADLKQQVSYLNGLIYNIEDDTEAQASRNRAMEKELKGEYLVKSPNLYADPWTWRTVYDYDPEVHAQRSAFKIINGREDREEGTNISAEQADIFVNWFMPGDKVGPEKSKL